MRPLLLLDIDGVLNPLGVREAPGFTAYRLGGMRVLLNPDHCRWLAGLAGAFELTWATSWERDADLVAERVGLPLGLPFVPFTRQTEWTVKLPDIVSYAADRPLAWLDDAHGPEAEPWAKTRGAPTLLVQTDHRVGLTMEHIERLRAFAAEATVGRG